MTVVLFSIAVMIGEAGRLHDETAGAMILHEGVEKCRHEKGISSEELEGICAEWLRLRFSFSSFEIDLREREQKVTGEGTGGEWSYEIQMTKFRPETFMRKITLLEGLVDEDEN